MDPITDVVQALRVAYYAEAGDYAAHHTETGRLLGFTVNGSGDEGAS